MRAVSEQLRRIGFYSNSVRMPLQEQLADKLKQLSGYADYRLFLCNSGAEANENALKLASFQTGRREVVAFRKSFHGRTGAALNVTDNDKIRSPLLTDSFPVHFFEIGEREKLRAVLQKERCAAVIIEGIQGVGGLDAPSADYLRFLRECCHQTGTLLILDEVQSGYGRTGRFFAHQIAPDLDPDLIPMAKGMGNGFPIGGVLIAPHVRATGGMLGTTFGGNHLSCAAGLTVLKTLETEDLLPKAAETGWWLAGQLNALPGVVRTRGRGLMLGLELEFPIKLLRERLLYEHRIFTGNSKNPNLLRLLPPLGITRQQLEPFLQSLQQLLPA